MKENIIQDIDAQVRREAAMKTTKSNYKKVLRKPSKTHNRLEPVKMVDSTRFPLSDPSGDRGMTDEMKNNFMIPLRRRKTDAQNQVQ